MDHYTLNEKNAQVHNDTQRKGRGKRESSNNRKNDRIFLNHHLQPLCKNWYKQGSSVAANPWVKGGWRREDSQSECHLPDYLLITTEEKYVDNKIPGRPRDQTWHL